MEIGQLLRAIPFEKVVEGVSDAPKKMPRGGLGIVPISLRGGLDGFLGYQKGGCALIRACALIRMNTVDQIC